MKIRFLFFASTREAVGETNVTLEIDEILNNSSNLLEFVKIKFPSLCQCDFRFALNKKYIDGNIILNYGYEIALIPPISGG